MRRFPARPILLALAVAAAAGVVVAQTLPAPRKVGPPQRIVSLNLCSDQLVVPLADRAQIAALTRNAVDPGMSAVAAEAKGLRLIRGSAEEVVALQPDLIAGVPSWNGPAMVALAEGDAPVLDAPFTNSLAEIEAEIRKTAAAVGHAQRGEAMIAAMRRDLAAIPATGRGRVAAYYQRRGYLTGSGTLIDELMRSAGLANLATKLGKPPLSQLSLEEMVAARPDVLIVESEDVTDLGTEMLQHPALRGVPRVVLPQAWTVCGGPAYVRAARSLSEQLARR